MRIVKVAIYILLIGLPYFILAQDKIPEYSIKTAMLEKFTFFVGWPAETGMSDTTQPFVLSVIGENPFDDLLKQSYKNHKIKNKNVEIKFISEIAEIGDSHLLFISSTKKKTLRKILTYTKNKPILTISDTEGYVQKGVHINLYQAANTIRFEINEKAVKDSGLYMSYQLFHLAKIVETEKDRNEFIKE